jgi:hypothetical protein
MSQFVKIGVGIGRTGTEGRFLRKGHENGLRYGGNRAAQSRAVQGMDKGERAGPGEPVHVPKSPELLRVGSSSVFCVFAGHVGRSDFLFRLAQKIGAMTQAAFTDY